MSDNRRTKLYAALGLDPDRRGAHCVAADMIDQGRSAEEAERYLRGAQWLDLRFPGGWGTTAMVFGSEVVCETIVPYQDEDAS